MMGPRGCCFLFWVMGGVIGALEEHPNAFVHMAKVTAAIMNITDCWICSHLPSHSSYQFPLTAWPAPLDDFYPSSTLGPTPVRGSALTQMTVRQAAQFPLCFSIPENMSKPDAIPLGEGTSCNLTFTWTGRTIDTFAVNIADRVPGITDCTQWWLTTGRLLAKAASVYGHWGLPTPPKRSPKDSCVVKQVRPYKIVFQTVIRPQAVTTSYLKTADYPLAHLLYLLHCQLENSGDDGITSECDNVYAIPSKIFNELYWVCGGTAYKELPAKWWGTCGLAILTPELRVMKELPKGKIRMQRNAKEAQELINSYYPLTRGQVIGGAAGCAIGAALVGGCSYAVTALGYAELRLQAVMEILANETALAIDRLAEEQGQIRKVALQNRMALDISLAAQGGVCAIVKQECCVFVSDFKDEIHDRADHIRKLAYVPPDTSLDWWGRITDFFGALGTKIVMALLAFAVILVIGCLVFRIALSSFKACVTPKTHVMVSQVSGVQNIHEQGGPPRTAEEIAMRVFSELPAIAV